MDIKVTNKNVLTKGSIQLRELSQYVMEEHRKFIMKGMVINKGKRNERLKECKQSVI